MFIWILGVSKPEKNPGYPKFPGVSVIQSLYCINLSILNELPINSFLVPGDGGSQLDAKLNKTDVVHYICQKKTADFFNIWLNLELLVPLIIDCWVDNMVLVYDNVTRTTSNSPGVTIRVPGWGSSEAVEWLDPTHASSGAYFKDIGNALTSIGYQRNVSLFGAPYDFRKAPSNILSNSVFMFNLNDSIFLLQMRINNGF